MGLLKRLCRALIGDDVKSVPAGNAKKPKFREIDIEVEKLPAPTPDWPDGYSFSMKEGGNGLNNQIEFKNDRHPGFLLTFTIDDSKDSTGCRFLPDPTDAMWVQPAVGSAPPACPDTVPAHWQEFAAIDVVDLDAANPCATLLVFNKNDRDAKFAFTFRFNIPGVAHPVIYDPIGTNKNGMEY